MGNIQTERVGSGQLLAEMSGILAFCTGTEGTGMLRIRERTGLRSLSYYAVCGRDR